MLPCTSCGTILIKGGKRIMKDLDKERMELIDQIEQIRQERPDVYDLLMDVWNEAMTLPENKQAEFVKNATPILMKYIH